MGGVAVVQNLAKPVKQKLFPVVKTSLDYLARSGWSVLENLPSGAGKEITKFLRTQRDIEGQISGQNVNQLKNMWASLDKTSRDAAFQAIKTNRLTGNQNIDLVINSTKTMQRGLLRELGVRGVRVDFLGMKVPIDIVPQNYPTVIKEQVFEPGALREEAINYLHTSGQFNSKADAEEFMRKLYGMEFGRAGVKVMTIPNVHLPDKFIETDPLVAYSSWVNSAARNISMHDVYGPRNDNLKVLIDVIKQTDGFAAGNFAKDAVDAALYGYSFTGRKFYKGRADWEHLARQYEGLTKLGRIAIAEPTQAFNILLKTSGTSFFKSLQDVVGNPDLAKNFALDSGALITETLSDLKAAANGRSWLQSMFHYTGFDMERRINITLAANAGKHYARELTEKLLQAPADRSTHNLLRTIGLEPRKILQQRGLSQEDIMVAAKRVAETTQFFHNPLDLPLMWQANPFMRVLFMYKNFIFNEGKLVKDVLFKDGLRDGKYQNWIYFATVFPAAGEIVGDLETYARGQALEYRREHELFQKSEFGQENPFIARYLDNITKLAGFGIFASMLSSFNRQNILHWLGGPVLGDLEDTTLALYDWVKEGDSKKIRKQFIKSIPVAGPAISAHTVEKEDEK